MAKLTGADRKKLGAKQFAGPGRTYPVTDRAHAADAKARATQQERAGKMTKAEKAKIDAAANRVLNKRAVPLGHKRGCKCVVCSRKRGK